MTPKKSACCFISVMWGLQGGRLNKHSDSLCYVDVSFGLLPFVYMFSSRKLASYGVFISKEAKGRRAVNDDSESSMNKIFKLET